MTNDASAMLCIKKCATSIFICWVAGSFLWKFATPFDKDHPIYAPFGDGHNYEVSWQYFIKEITNHILYFILILSLSIIVSFLSKRAAVLFWIFASYRVFILLSYFYNHNSWAWPVHIAQAAMFIWGVYLFGWVKEPGAKVIKM